ncbi:MAG: site-2 protease family protein, partial [Acidobacteriota bacterium]
MKWSIKLVTIAGIGVYMHLTFLLLLGWMALRFYSQGQSLTEILTGMVSVLLLFVVVVLHEFGHALTARRFGIGTRDITLLPIGGVARLERMPEDPKQELLVALAGPAVNVALAIGIFLLLLFTGSLPEEVPPNIMQDIPLFLLVINIMLALFNMLPAFPMDGGRVLRALLAMRMEYVSATQIAAQIGQAMALLFGFAGLFASPFLIFIALFVWIAASEEAGLVQMKTAMAGMPISKAM